LALFPKARELASQCRAAWASRYPRYNRQPNPRISTAVAMLIRLQWPMHSAEQPTDPEGDHDRGIGLRLDSVT
jgi:hypothetical protein